jgi:DNA polymerase-3 subunit epsilon
MTTLLDLVRGRNILCFDTETTGLDPERDQVIEIGWCLLNYVGEVGVPGSTLINPTIRIKNSSIHGITDAMVADAPCYADAVRLMPRCGVMCAYNATFDIAFMAGSLPEDAWVTDAASLAKTHFGYKENYKFSLAQAAKKLKVEDIPGAHRAARDAQVLAQVMQALLY